MGNMAGSAGHGLAGNATAWSGLAWHGSPGGARHGKSSLATARSAEAWLGVAAMASMGTASSATAGQGRLVQARQAGERWGMTWPGRQGIPSQGRTRTALVCRGLAGMARPGLASDGQSGHGGAGFGMAGSKEVAPKRATNTSGAICSNQPMRKVSPDG